MLPRVRRARSRSLILATAVVAAVLLAACGGGGDGGNGTGRSAPARAAAPATIALDFTPNAVHAPIYAAVREGLDRRHGVALRIREPGSSPNSLALLTSGRVDVGILDIHDLAIARQQGVDVVGVAALVQKPLAALVARAPIRRPRDLEGRTVGVSGLPSDPAFVRAIVEGDGGDASRIREVTIGFQAVSSILSRRVDAVPVFWNAEAVALRERGVRIREFRVEDYGAPPYPEVVLVTARRTLQRKRAVVAGAVAAIGDGVRSVLARPEPAVRQVAQAAGQADLDLVRAQMRALRPVIVPPMRLGRPVLERWARFDERFGIVRRRPDVDRAFAFDVAR
ncbi:MAG: putative hydroxymethylpyrimidine transport system substrate-binding protein [Solirubrobacteraceae bacterium]|jgi:putative hydroxymethylpyrimidine transport system substrate-binding protein|nr:putative hydroxymethylpyrimidine transport system substrate-binding protein [Solirubrobacteraceae bacterium]